MILPSIEQIDIELARRSLSHFIKQAWHVIEPGQPYLHGWHIDAMAEHLQAITDGQINRLLINVPPGAMKLIADEQPILTPIGWRKHGDLRVGDYVYGSDGKPVKIIRISPKGYADYAIHFTNHEIIKCNGDHLWTVYDRWAKKWKTINTTELFNAETESDRNRFFIPQTQPLDNNSEKQFKIHPYFLGCWLGDGSSTKPCITHAIDDIEHLQKLESLNYVRQKIFKNGETALTSSYSKQGIIEEIRSLGLFNNKHIPDCYFAGSLEQRLELLAGIIDTDGCVRADGRVSISTCSEVLAKDYAKLIVSFGWRVCISKKQTRGYGQYKNGFPFVWVIGFNPTFKIPTALKRKSNLPLLENPRRIAIKAIHKITPEPGHCITVENEDGLYVVGDKCVITHNSLITGVFWPAWEWGPRGLSHHRIIGAAHQEKLAIRDNLKMRRLVSSEWYQSRYGDKVILTGDQNAKTKFENIRTGFREAVAAGSITGSRGDRVIIDDPLSVDDAKSDVILQSREEWFLEAVPTRLNNPISSAIIVIMQRLNERDTSGIIISKELGYEHLMLPMEFEPKRRCKTSIGFVDPRTEENELLFPERFPRAVVDRDKKVMGPQATAGQLQQRPAPADGGIFKLEWFTNKYYRELPPVLYIVQSWDTAFKKGKDNDYNVCTTWAVCRNGYYLIDRYKEKLEFPELKKQFINLAAQYRPAHILVEDKASGQSLVQELRRETRLPVRPIQVDTDKEARANAVTTTMQYNVYLPEGKSWVRDFLDQLLVFPNGAHDDDVDSATQALHFMVLQAPVQVQNVSVDLFGR